MYLSYKQSVVQQYLLRDVLSVSITLRHVGSKYGMSLWSGCLHTVSVLLAVSFRALWLFWMRKKVHGKSISL